MKVLNLFILASLIGPNIGSGYSHIIFPEVEGTKVSPTKPSISAWGKFTQVACEVNEAHGGKPADLIIIGGITLVICLLLWEQLKSILWRVIQGLGALLLAFGLIYLIQCHWKLLLMVIPTWESPSVAGLTTAQAVGFVSVVISFLKLWTNQDKLKRILAGYVLGPFIDEQPAKITACVFCSDTNCMLGSNSMDAALLVSSRDGISNEKFDIGFTELRHEQRKDTDFAGIFRLLEGSPGVDSRGLGGQALDVVENDSLFFIERESEWKPVFRLCIPKTHRRLILGHYCYAEPHPGPGTPRDERGSALWGLGHQGRVGTT